MCVSVTSHPGTVNTQVWLVSSVSVESVTSCLSVWPVPLEADRSVKQADTKKCFKEE